jgi:UPF0716 protein FxsA
VFGRFVLLFSLVPVVEILILVWIGTKTSFWVPVGLVLGAGLLGTWLMRVQGWQTVGRIRAESAAGQVPAQALFDGLFVLLAGLLLIVPGVLTDILAILLLIPFTRQFLKRYVTARSRLRFASFVSATRPVSENTSRDEIIDVRVLDSSSPPNGTG